MYTQGSDNKKDRKLGEYWERRFCIWAGKFSKSFTPMQIGRQKSAQAFTFSNKRYNSYTLPDVTIWSSPGEHHEIKHKSPIPNVQWYGLEVYRLNALLWFAQETKQKILYTIHDHSLSGGRDSTDDKLEHWFTVNVLDLPDRISHQGETKSYINGQVKDNIPIFYWHKDLWIPLYDFWTDKCQMNKNEQLSLFGDDDFKEAQLNELHHAPYIYD